MKRDLDTKDKVLEAIKKAKSFDDLHGISERIYNLSRLRKCISSEEEQELSNAFVSKHNDIWAEYESKVEKASYNAKAFVDTILRGGFPEGATEMARKYVSEHRKRRYTDDDIYAVLSMLPEKILLGSHGHYETEDDISFERAVKAYEGKDD